MKGPKLYFVSPAILKDIAIVDGGKVDLTSIADGAVGMMIAFESREAARAHIDRDPVLVAQRDDVEDADER